MLSSHQTIALRVSKLIKLSNLLSTANRKLLTANCQPKTLPSSWRQDDSTIDNKATITQIAFLARLYLATKDERYKESFLKGMEFLLGGQYDNGGWPQFWPKNRDYQVHITYNDNAMVNVMRRGKRNTTISYDK